MTEIPMPVVYVLYSLLWIVALQHVTMLLVTIMVILWRKER
jgi:hypothetical protein